MFVDLELSSIFLRDQLKSTYLRDIYHLPAYFTLESNRHQGSCFLWQYDDNYISIQIPLINSSVQQSLYPENLLSPYGYPGIINLSGEPKDWFSVFLQYHKDVLEAGFQYTFLRFHPLYNPISLPSFPGFLFQKRGNTVAIDLNFSTVSIVKSFSENHRRNLHKLKQNNYSCLINSRQYLEPFFEAYTQTMIRRRANSNYFLPLSYFISIMDDLAPYVYFIVVVDGNGKFATGGLFSFFKEIGQYLYGATHIAHLRYSPAKLMINEAIHIGQELGCHWLHLGGGYGSSNVDGLARFKRGFSSINWQYNTLEIFHPKFEEYLEIARLK